MEVDVGSPSQGETEGIGIQGEVFQGWTRRRGKRYFASFAAKSIARFFPWVSVHRSIHVLLGK